MAVADESNRPGFGGRPRQIAGVRVDPGPDDPHVGGDDPPGALQQGRPAGRSQGAAGEPVAQRPRRDGRVVAAAPQVGRHVRGGHRPADAQPRQPVGLRQAPGDDRPLRPPPHRRRVDAVVLDAAVDLVGEHPGAVPFRDLADRRHLGFGQPRPGRVVRVADGDELRAAGHQRAQLVDVGRPAGGRRGPLGAQRPGPHAGAEPFGQPLHLPVVGLHHHHFVARLDQAPAGGEVGLGAAVGDDHVLFGRAGEAGRHGGAQFRRAVGLRVGKRLAEQRRGLVRVEELAQLQRLHAALRQVDLDLVLVDGLEALKLEGGDSQGRIS